VAFASVVAAGLPVMLALVSLGVTLGALYFLAGVTDMNVYVTNTASIVGDRTVVSFGFVIHGLVLIPSKGGVITS